MNEKINPFLYSLALLAALGCAVWYLVGDIPLNQILTFLILAIVVIEIASLIIVGKHFPESHTQFKIGMIVGLLILLGIKQMAPSFFPPLTVSALAINFLYNFYANAKRKKGAFKRRKRKKLQL